MSGINWKRRSLDLLKKFKQLGGDYNLKIAKEVQVELISDFLLEQQALKEMLNTTIDDKVAKNIIWDCVKNLNDHQYKIGVMSGEVSRLSELN